MKVGGVGWNGQKLMKLGESGGKWINVDECGWKWMKYLPCYQHLWCILTERYWKNKLELKDVWASSSESFDCSCSKCRLFSKLNRIIWLWQWLWQGGRQICFFSAQCLWPLQTWNASRSRASCTPVTDLCGHRRSTPTWWRWPSTMRKKTSLSPFSSPISHPRSLLMLRGANENNTEDVLFI